MMMMFKLSPRRLLLQVEQEGRDLDKIQADFKWELAKLRKRVVKESKALLANPGLVSDRDQLRLAETLKVLSQMESVLKDAGLHDFLDKYRNSYTKVMNSALKYFSGAGVDTKLVRGSVDLFDAYVSFTELTLTKTLDSQLVEPIRTGLFQSTFGGLSHSEVVDNVIAIAEGVSLNRIVGETNWALESFNRQVTVESANRLGMDIYQYQGPDDALTSEQCRAMLEVDEHGVPGMLYRDEISVDLHENLTRDPLIYGGHPNCRHKWYPVTEDYAISLGFEPRESE